MRAKILGYDIEASSLNADYGIVLCVGFGYVDASPVKVIDLHDYDGGNVIKQEKKLLKHASELLLEADIWLSHYGSRGRFDLNYLQSRLAYHRLPFLPPTHPQIDTWRISRDNLRLSSNRLGSISTHLGTKEQKNAILPEQWILALSGDKRAMAYVVEHCRRDIAVLREDYLRLRPLAANHPNVALMNDRPDGCKFCGSTRMMSLGWQYTQARKYRRFECRECGGINRARKAEKVA